MVKHKTYIAIDLKSFYASVECKERNRDPLTTNLVVADKSRTEKTICLVSNAEFKIFNIDKNEYVKQYTTYPWVVRIVCVGCYNRLCRLPESFHKCIFPCII